MTIYSKSKWELHGPWTSKRMLKDRWRGQNLEIRNNNKNSKIYWAMPQFQQPKNAKPNFHKFINMKTLKVKAIIELTWSIEENKRLVCLYSLLNCSIGKFTSPNSHTTNCQLHLLIWLETCYKSPLFITILFHPAWQNMIHLIISK